MNQDKPNKQWYKKSSSNNWNSPLAPKERKIFISGLFIGMSLGIFIGNLL